MGKCHGLYLRIYKDIITLPDPVIQLSPSVPYLLIDELRLSVHHLIEVQNLAAGLFGLEQSSASEDLFDLGSKLNQWLEISPEPDSILRDFSLFLKTLY
jgi:hypothetical protein